MKAFPLTSLFLSALLIAPLLVGQDDPFRSDPLPEGYDPFNPAARNPETKEFRVSKANESKANKELFMRLWEAVQRPQFTPQTVKRTFHIRQVAGKAEGLNRYLAGDEAVLLRNPELFEGSVVTVWANPAGVYDYTTVMGSSRRVRQFKEAIQELDPEAPNKERFVADLKIGETYTVVTLEEKSCRTCMGDGKLGSLAGGGECAPCGGTGNLLQTWLLKW